ncbi:MAG: ABC transporter permease subunit [Culicoidibacterales bacterium]
MNIWRFELRQSLMRSVIWTIIITGIAGLFLSVYPSYQNGADEFLKLLEGYPPQLIAAFNINPDTIFTYLGFYAFVLPFVFIAGSIYATNLALTIMGREKSMNASEFLLAKPVSRTMIWLQKILALKTTLIIHNVIFTVIMVGITSYFDQTQITKPSFWMMTLALFLIELIFANLGILLAVLLKRLKSITSLAVGIAVSFYVISLLQALLENELMAYLTPFQYVNPQYILENQHYDCPLLAIGLGIIILSALVSYTRYTNQDVG